MTEQAIESALHALQREEDGIRERKRDLHRHLAALRDEAAVAKLTPRQRDAVVRAEALRVKAQAK